MHRFVRPVQWKSLKGSHMQEIWKFSLEIVGTQPVVMPEHANILSAHVQDGTICLWALVDPTWKDETREIELVGTGHLFDSGYRTFIGTVQYPPYVWHVFEVKTREKLQAESRAINRSAMASSDEVDRLVRELPDD